MRVLVTGGTGYLGAAIVRAMVRRGHDTIVFARHARTSGLPGTLVDGDVRDSAAVARAASGADAICHSAALVTIWRRRREDFDDVNVGGLRNVIDVCRQQGIRRLVYTSSFLALPPTGESAPLAANDYQRTKVVAHGIARAAAREGVPIVTLIPGVIYGPGPATEANLVGRLIRDHLNRRLPGVLGATRHWSYAWIDDVAEAHVTVLERRTLGSEYILGGQNAPQMQIFQILRELTGRDLPRRIPFSLGSVIGALDENRANLFGGTPHLTRGTVEIFRHDWMLDSARSVDELSYRVTPLETGVRTLLSGRI